TGAACGSQWWSAMAAPPFGLRPSKCEFSVLCKCQFAGSKALNGADCRKVTQKASIKPGQFGCAVRTGKPIAHGTYGPAGAIPVGDDMMFREVTDVSVVSVLISVKDKAGFRSLVWITEPICAQEQTQFERHVEAWQTPRRFRT